MYTPFSEPIWVACLCAAWCGTCREYRATFDSVAATSPDARFLWIDVEDEADLVDPVEIENFPTLLIAVRGEPTFFGPLTPHRETLVRLVRSCAEGVVGPALATDEIRGLVNRLQNRTL